MTVVTETLLDALRGIGGEAAVLTGAAAEPYATDVYRSLAMPEAVLRPDSVEVLQALVRTVTAAGRAIYPRGGGASYTDGYLPVRAGGFVIDTGRLNRIVEINEADNFVTVEAGVTWAALRDALAPLDLRTPFFGPFSGLVATVGGSMSQHAISHGSGTHGISAQSALAMDVVLASGELLRTGSAARGAAPFARFYGPDLTGLFTGDCGGLGIKVRVTLPLLRRKPAFQGLSFAFPTLAGLAEAMRQAALERLDDESFGLDAALAQGQIGRQDGRAILAMARSVMASSPGVLAGLAQLARMARAGTKALSEAKYMAHFLVEGINATEAAIRAGRLRALMRGATEIPNTIPTIVRGMPFAPLVNTLGPKGERWVPIHGILPHSKVVAFHDALQAVYAGHAAEMARLGVWTGGMFSTVGSSGFLYEIAFYWPGAQTAYHRAVVPQAYLAALPAYAHDAAAADFVGRLKAEITDLFSRFGAVHFQLGKSYPFAAVLEPQALALMRTLKAALDPDGLMNPGALGL